MNTNDNGFNRIDVALTKLRARRKRYESCSRRRGRGQSTSPAPWKASYSSPHPFPSDDRTPTARRSLRIRRHWTRVERCSATKSPKFNQTECRMVDELVIFPLNRGAA